MYFKKLVVLLADHATVGKQSQPVFEFGNFVLKTDPVSRPQPFTFNEKIGHILPVELDVSPPIIY